MSLFEIGAVLIGLSAVFGYINHRYLRAPHTIGLVLIALAASLAMLLVESLAPAANVDGLILGVLGSIDFHETLMHGTWPPLPAREVAPASAVGPDAGPGATASTLTGKPPSRGFGCCGADRVPPLAGRLPSPEAFAAAVRRTAASRPGPATPRCSKSFTAENRNRINYM